MTIFSPAPTLRRSAEVKRLANSFCHAQLLMSAHGLGVFDFFESVTEATEEEFCTVLGVHPRGARDVLHGLVLLGLLDKQDDHYRNTDVASSTLVPGGDDYIGGFLRRAEHMLYPAWGNLTEALTTGRPQTPGAGQDQFLAMLEDPTRFESYLQMMDSANGSVAEPLAEAFDWASYRTIVDVGGCRGNLAANLIARHAHLSATIFDLPPMGPALKRHAESRGLADRIDFRAGDFFIDELPTADVVILGHVLHNWSPIERELLVARAFAAVAPGGALLVYDAMLTEEPTDLARILVSINMLLVTEGGSEYTPSAATDWLRNAGCVDVDVAALGITDTLVIGRKKATSR